jgi:hypothetical protein
LLFAIFMYGLFALVVAAVVGWFDRLLAMEPHNRIGDELSTAGSTIRKSRSL